MYNEIACSVSGRYYAVNDVFHTNRLLICKYTNRGGFPIAIINQSTGDVIGIQGNTSNRLDRLDAIEKADVYTLIITLIKNGIIPDALGYTNTKPSIFNKLKALFTK